MGQSTRGRGSRRPCATPVMTEGEARGLIPDDHPWCAGFYDAALSWAARLVREADAVMLIECKQDRVMGYAAPPGVAAAARLNQVDPDAAEIGRNRPVDVGLTGDTDAVLTQLRCGRGALLGCARGVARTPGRGAEPHGDLADRSGRAGGRRRADARDGGVHGAAQAAWKAGFHRVQRRRLLPLRAAYLRRAACLDGPASPPSACSARVFPRRWR